MSVTRGDQSQSEHRDAGNAGHPCVAVSSEAHLGGFVNYVRLLPIRVLRSAGDWRWFWVGEVIVWRLACFWASWQALRKGP